MTREQSAPDGLIFPPMHLDADRRRPTWSVNVDLPPDIDAEIHRYVEEDDPTSWTVVIHGALYIYRWQFRTKEELDAELREAIEAGIRSADEEGTIAVTPQFWEDLRQRGERRIEQIHSLQSQGALGNLLLPKELYDFILERIASGECRTCAASAPGKGRRRNGNARRSFPNGDRDALVAAMYTDEARTRSGLQDRAVMPPWGHHDGRKLHRIYKAAR